MSSNKRARLALAATAAVALATLAPGAVQAADRTGSGTAAPAAHAVAKPAKPRTLKVMTQNLYLGSSLDPALQATTGAEFVQAVAEIYGTAVTTDFPTRAKAIADTIAARKPDLIGLQEVSKWTTTPVKAGANPPSFDFLHILRTELAARGMHYKIAGVSDNAAIGPAPLVAPAFGCDEVRSAIDSDCWVSFADRDVILKNMDRGKLFVGSPYDGDYATQQSFDSPLGPIDFGRGWVYVDGSLHGKKFRIANTHLEVEDYPDVQVAQAAEFVAGPANPPAGRALIVTGDFNSAADGSNTPTYANLVSSGLTDSWVEVHGDDPGLTCCQNGTLSNTVADFDKRIDLILGRGIFAFLDSRVIDDQPLNATGTIPVWPSDHAGVISRMQLK
jgi:endonuclease/exonuclease/phosphatase family metal-dependent hydrolase